MAPARDPSLRIEEEESNGWLEKEEGEYMLIKLEQSQCEEI